MSYRHDPPHELMSGGRDGRVDRSYRIPFFIPEGALVPFGSALRGLIGTLDSGTELISYWDGTYSLWSYRAGIPRYPQKHELMSYRHYPS